jgi:phosphoribosyl 1,2-cyclic phosphodiesterase
MPELKIEAVPGLRFQVGNMNVSVTKAVHTDTDAVGFRFKSSDFGDFAYTSDTEYFEDIGKYYEDVRLLILCVMRPAGKPWKGHMTTNDAVKIVQATHPEQVVLTHLGMQMIFKGPANEAKLIEEETRVPTVAATDGMHITFGEQIQIETKLKRTQQELGEFF